jgi:hypothetical protein
VTCSRRSSGKLPRSLQPQAGRDDRLLARLRELAQRFDPMPEHTAAAARSAFSAAVSESEAEIGAASDVRVSEQ